MLLCGDSSTARHRSGACTYMRVQMQLHGWGCAFRAHVWVQGCSPIWGRWGPLSRRRSPIQGRRGPLSLRQRIGGPGLEERQGPGTQGSQVSNGCRRDRRVYSTEGRKRAIRIVIPATQLEMRQSLGFGRCESIPKLSQTERTRQ